MHNWSRKPLPGAGSGFVELGISAIANEAVTDDVASDGKGWFDDGPERDLSHMDFAAEAIDGIPVRFARRGGIPYCAMFRAGSTERRQIEVGRQLGSLIVLHAASLPPEKAMELQEVFKGDPEHGIELMMFTVHYADGTSTSFSVNYGWNVLHWRSDPVGYGGKRLYNNSYPDFPGVFAKYLPDARSFWEGHTGEALKRKYPPDIAIYQYEWPNPSPERRIDSIEMRSRGVPNVSYALLAVTGRTAKDSTKAEGQQLPGKELKQAEGRHRVLGRDDVTGKADRGPVARRGQGGFSAGESVSAWRSSVRMPVRSTRTMR